MTARSRYFAVRAHLNSGSRSGDETASVAALYDMFNKGSEAAGMREERRQLLAGAEGATIEVGAGTGLNLDHYPQAVTRLVLAEPDRHMRRRLRERVDALDRAAEVIDASAEGLHFPDATFDTAVVTLVLCSVPDQEEALAEIARVLRPDRRLLFMEHVRSGEPKVAKRQGVRPLVPHRRRVQPQPGDTGSDRGIRAQSRVGQAQARFPKAPKVERPMIVGTARR